MSHGAKCICQICTCGRHKCPHDRNASSFQLGDGKTGLSQEKSITQTSFESSSYHQKSQRTTPTRHYSTISSLFTEENNTGTGGTQTRNIKSSEYRAKTQNGEQSVAETRSTQRETVQLPPILKADNGRATSQSGRERNSRSSIQQALRQHSEERANSAESKRQSTLTGAKKTVSINEQITGYQKTHRNSSQVFEARRLHQIAELKDNSNSGTSIDNAKVQTRAEKNGTNNQQHKLIEVNVNRNYSPRNNSQINELFKESGADRATSSKNTSNKTPQDNINSPKYSKKQAVKAHDRHSATHREIHGKQNMAHTTQNQEDFIYRKAEHTQIRHPSDHHILYSQQSRTSTNKTDQQSKTQNQEDYTHISGERYAKKVPSDNKILQGAGQQFEARTQNQEDFTHISGERYAQKVPSDNKILQGDGQHFEARTQNQEDFTHISGERYAKKVPSDNKILQGDGQQFEARTQNQEDFTHISGERYAKKVPSDNKILQGDGQHFEAKTQNQEDFTHISGERYAKKVPSDNKILQGDGQHFEAKTQNQEDFIHRRNERVIRSVPIQHKILSSEGRKFDAKTVHQEEFVDLTSDIVAQSGIILKAKRDSSSVAQSRSHIYETSNFMEESESGFEGYSISSGSRLTTSHHAGYLTQNAGSSYDIDYQYRPVPCIAGELLESVKRNHANTEHYNYNACDSGHHFYKEKAILEEEETQESESSVIKK